jgi:carbon storage regulator
MLVLTRKLGEKIVIDGGITVTVLEIAGQRVRVGVQAPDDVRILRGELACWLDLGTTPDSAGNGRPEGQPLPLPGR